MNTKRGYFLIADITGFTSFIAGSELEHSQFILNEILKKIVSGFTPAFALAEIEGDAVFVYAPVETFSRSEIILEMIESLYFEFRDTKVTFKRLITCNCKACEMVHTLDLKFIIHSGDYVLNEVAGKAKPFGTAVNTVHRLLKNKINDATGWKAYVLFTEESLNDTGMSLSDFHIQKENYEHIGEVNTVCIDLDKRYKEFIGNRKIEIKEEEADHIIERDYPVAVPVLWEWVNNPVKRSLWLEVSDWKPIERPFGRTGKGAANHCANSNFFEKLIDYRPFDYYTSEMSDGKFSYSMTGKFMKTEIGTKFKWITKLNKKLPGLIKKIYCIFIYKYALKIDKAFNKLDELLKEEEIKMNLLFKKEVNQ